MGLEVSGRVAGLGRKVKGLAVGDGTRADQNGAVHWVVSRVAVGNRHLLAGVGAGGGTSNGGAGALAEVGGLQAGRGARTQGNDELHRLSGVLG